MLTYTAEGRLVWPTLLKEDLLAYTTEGRLVGLHY